MPNRRTTFIGWCEGEERSIPLEVERKESKEMRQRSVVATLSFTPVGDLQATEDRQPARKHFPCFYRVIETRQVWENEKCCGNTSRRRVFPQLFRVLPNLPECFFSSCFFSPKPLVFL